MRSESSNRHHGLHEIKGAGAVRTLLDEHGFKFSKSKGQNFLVDANIPEKIVRLSGIDKNNHVYEVGPGIGALTAHLCKAAGRVTAVEIDQRLLPILAVTLAPYSNVDVIHSDILKLNIRELVEGRGEDLTPCICANLPYSITTPALTAFVNAGVFETITVMVQREVARRICAMPGTSEYGSLSVFINYYAHTEILFEVSPDCFLPRPEVYSAVVKMKKRTNRTLNPEEEKMFFRIVRASFEQRRKTLVNALYAGLNGLLNKEEIAQIIENCGFDRQLRGETLGVESFLLLAERILYRKKV